MSWWKNATSSEYGVKRSTGSHGGKDFPLPKGTPITPLSGGIATVPKPDSINGNYVIVHHPTGYSTAYLHLDKVTVNDGQPVNASDIVGLSGNTGRVRGAGGGFHLHLGVRDNKGRRINPDVVLNNLSLLGNFTVPEGFGNRKDSGAPNVESPAPEQQPQQVQMQTPFDLEAATESNMLSLLAGIGAKKKKKKKTLGILEGLI